MLSILKIRYLVLLDIIYVNLQAIFFLFKIDTVWICIKIFSIPNKAQFSETAVHTLLKLYDVPVDFVTPPPSLEAGSCFISGRRRVVVARYRIICIVLRNSFSNIKKELYS